MKAILTFEDSPDGTVKIDLEFDPPLQRTDDFKASDAQAAAMFALDRVTSELGQKKESLCGLDHCEGVEECPDCAEAE